MDIDIRFEDAPEYAYDLIRGLIKEHFKELGDCKILILMDLKERKTGDMITLGRITKTNDLTRHLTIYESGSDSGYDYIMYLDKMMWGNTDDTDRIRLIRHELRHTHVDIESKNPYKLRPHTIEDFHSEVKLNDSDPRWRDRVAVLVAAKYDSLKNSQQKLPGME